LGSPPNEHGWTIKVRDPYDSHKVGDVVRLEDYSLSTSGSYEKFFKIGGKTYCHIMDPHSGWPVQNMLSTAVLAPTTTQSEALSKPFFIWGPEGSRKYLASHANLQVVFYQPAGTPGNFTRTVLRSGSFQVPSGGIAEVER
jgi:thiamine biosynthesis lipoprotein